MDWKHSLDRYLTSEPDFGFDLWCERVYDSFSEEFFIENYEWIDKPDGTCNDWFNKLYGKDHKQSSMIIERAFGIYKQKLDDIAKEQAEEHLKDIAYHEKLMSLYKYDDNGFCDGFTMP